MNPLKFFLRPRFGLLETLVWALELSLLLKDQFDIMMFVLLLDWLARVIWHVFLYKRETEKDGRR